MSFSIFTEEGSLAEPEASRFSQSSCPDHPEDPPSLPSDGWDDRLPSTPAGFHVSPGVLNCDPHPPVARAWSSDPSSWPLLVHFIYWLDSRLVPEHLVDQPVCC